MKISFTGTQSGMKAFQKTELSRLLTELKCAELCNGACIGADEEALLISIEAGIKIFHLFPSYIKPKQSSWVGIIGYTEGRYEKFKDDIQVKMEKEEAPLIRNKKIVDESSILIACPKEHEHTLRSGTWATIRYAWHKKKKVITIPPIERENDLD